MCLHVAGIGRQTGVRSPFGVAGGTHELDMPMKRMNACGASVSRLGLAASAVALLALAGCVGSPTYGTGKRADQQLLEDVTGILDLSPVPEGERIEYKPRPPLVTPAQKAALPPPQESAAASS